ncbi:BEL1-like homeodomain protein 1 [Primulina tabacum]|uniref:BEL1-like homeodomain protein 1 n=1 Tax=Primulina tabacum TaxID=48773 RepID=UPI003F59F0C1
MYMYHQGGSAIQATDDLQTLYLMNPNNVQPPQTNVIFLNSAGTSTTVRGPGPHAPLPQAQQFVGFQLSQDPKRPLSFPGQQDEVHAPYDQYQTTIPSFDCNLWRSGDHDPNTTLPTPKCLSLSLSSDQTSLNKSLLNDQDLLGQSSIGMVLPKLSSGVESKRGKIMGSKYLKAAQQILDEVANFGEGIAIDGLVRSKDKAKIITASNHGGAEKHTTAQRQEIQMKKAKLVAILHDVEQRYRNYQHQMHMMVALFEQTAGIGSSKRYTQLAYRTISKRFRCLKDEISSQISALKNRLRDQDEIEDTKFGGSRLEFLVHRFRQQCAWRTQRGLPERAVSVLRAWLFEHFLHPYPKDSDKNMMAKQTGLTRNQVSNWFINARVRLWKPMVEEMYLEEMKNQQQIHSEETTTKSKRISTDKELGGRKLIVAPNDQPENCSATPKIDQLNAFQSKKHNRILNQVIKPSTVGASIAELISSLNMENSIPAHPKKARKDDVDTDQDNSLNSTNLVSQISKGFSMSVANTSSSSHGYFSRHGRFISTEQKATGFHGNSVSLTLTLPPSASSHWSQGLRQHQQNLPSNSTFEFGKRTLETGIVESGSWVKRVQESSIGYEILDFQNRNPFPATLLPDFMA